MVDQYNYSVVKIKKAMCPKCKTLNVIERKLNGQKIHACMNFKCGYNSPAFVEV